MYSTLVSVLNLIFPTSNVDHCIINIITAGYGSEWISSSNHSSPKFFSTIAIHALPLILSTCTINSWSFLCDERSTDHSYEALLNLLMHSPTCSARAAGSDLPDLIFFCSFSYFLKSPLFESFVVYYSCTQCLICITGSRNWRILVQILLILARNSLFVFIMCALIATTLYYILSVLLPSF